jgi:hypothetical protein
VNEQKSVPTTKRLAQAAVLGILSLGAVGVTTMGAVAPAAARGTSGEVLNCWTQWWNTAWAQKCSSAGAAFTGTYISRVACSSEPDKSLRVGRAKGSTKDMPGADCSFRVSNGRITYI